MNFYFMECGKGPVYPFSAGSLTPFGAREVCSYQIMFCGWGVVESRYAVVRRNRTIHSRMREYLWTLKHMDGLETIVLPIGDGMTVSVKE